MKIDSKKIHEYHNILENHSLLVTNTISSIEDLRIFMQYHVFAVWDFMSLLKTIQHSVVPSTELWMPTKGNRSEISRMINEIVLCEETDLSPDGLSSISHFDLYLQAMLEIGSDIAPITEYLEGIEKHGFNFNCPEPAKKFISTTFSMIKKGSHCAASSFCYGRETIIPSMFERILRQLNISELDAPKFHYYLSRHIQVDGEEHGPMSEKLVNFFCNDNPILIHEAEQAAIESIKSRIKFFDEIEKKILLS